MANINNPFDFTSYDFALFLYEELRIDLKQLITADVVYLSVIRSRIEDLNLLNEILNSKEISDEQGAVLDILFDKYTDR